MSSISEMVISDIRNRITGGKPKPGFCDDCRAELRQSQSATNQTTMHFAGPVLVRTELLYQVLTLPGACNLYIGDSLDTQVATFLADWRERDPDETWWTSGNLQAEQDRALRAIAAAEQDPKEAVRKEAVELGAVLRAKINSASAAAEN